MAMQLGALRSALVAGGAPPDLADKAAEEVAAFDHRIAGVETSLTVLKWMVGTNITMTLVVLASAFALWAKLGDIGGQLGQLARTLH
jgi:hypothetical protein